ncbi:MAG: FAD-dependent oxidoreductase [Solirubrobacterales bacterium]|nr:FAD-dependent oxidoreductase [Solirubrobacterales bacterium]
MARRLVVVGGVAAGLSAAGRARRLQRDLEVTVFERTGFCSYTACGLPYYISHVIGDHADLVMRTPQELAREGVDVRVRHEVSEIDTANRRIRVSDLESGSESTVGYDELVIATGASPIAPVPGTGRDGSFTVRTIEDALAIDAWIASRRPRRGVIVGGGYIGLEMAEALGARGIATTILEREADILPLVDPDVAAEVVAELRRHGVEVVTGAAVEEVEGDGRVTAVRAGGQAWAAEIVIMGIGVRPDVAVPRAAGIPIGPLGAISVDPRMRTGVDGVWAAGDCVQTRHLLHDGPAYIPLGTTANKQGRIAGANIGGLHEEFGGVVGTSVLKVCDLEVGRTGLTLRQAQAAGLDAAAGTVEHKSRAAYYPGGRPITVKIVAERGTGRLLGAQLAGGEGVAKRLDVIAAALHGAATVDDVAGFDLSYAPPFAPVWDPLLLAARQAEKAL